MHIVCGVPIWGNVAGCNKHIIRAFIDAYSWRIEIWQFLNLGQEWGNDRRLSGYDIPMWECVVIHPLDVIYHTAWGSALLVLLRWANARASIRGTSNRYRLSRSFFILTVGLWVFRHQSLNHRPCYEKINFNISNSTNNVISFFICCLSDPEPTTKYYLRFGLYGVNGWI